MLGLIDTLRQIRGDGLGWLGLEPTECRYRIVATGPRWRLRAYLGATTGPPLLIVAAPIKRPYIWDLTASVSVVRHCLRSRLPVHLLEWMSPSHGDKNAGIADYATLSIGQGVAAVAHQQGGRQPFIMGHSLGGTFAAIFAAFAPPSIRGLVLLSTPLCFVPGSCRFRDAIVAMAPRTLSAMEIVPGSLLSQLSVMAAPETFLWSRLVDAALSIADPAALWSNPESQNSGKIALIRKFTRNGQQCETLDYRLITKRRPVGPQHYRLSSCLQPDGQWRLT